MWGPDGAYPVMKDDGMISPKSSTRVTEMRTATHLSE